MTRNYGFDTIDGRQVPQLVIQGDHVLSGVHEGTVHVESGLLTLKGTLQGTLDIQSGASAIILGIQAGSVHLETGATITVIGAIEGSTHIQSGARVVVEPKGKLAGSLHNEGLVIVKGVFGGSRSGRGELRLEGEGFIKEPIIENGVSYYLWH